MGTGVNSPEAASNARPEAEQHRTNYVALQERLQPLLACVAAAQPTGHEADKAFYDSLEGDL